MAHKRKVALITGAAGGIGNATASLFAARGWDIIPVDKSRARFQVDLARVDQVAQFVEQVKSSHTALDALVNNAAEQIAKPLLETAPEEWDRLIATNVRAIYLLMRGLHPLLANAAGSVVNVASVHAISTSRGLAAYAASKAGVVGLTRASALEFAGDGVRVNAVLPGAIDTPMLADGLKRQGSGGLEALVKKHPLGRIGKPADVAEAIYFLADPDRASFITGQTLVVDGGASARLSTES
jgi:glucose 1-dehydrogenase